MKKPLLLAALTPTLALAGPYAASGIPSSSTGFVGWATGVSNLTRGLQNIADPSGPYASVGSAADAIGPVFGAENGTGSLSVVSLGDGGLITLTFAQAIRNGAGDDFAVFENGFASGGGVYAELGFVEVSSNGTDFFRFDAVSLTQTATQIGGFGTLDPTNVHNLAGGFASGQGAGFDLGELVGRSPLLDVDNVGFVRVVDVVGSLNPLYARYDSRGNAINDPYATPFASGGFDLDGVGVINAVPEPASFAALAFGALAFLRHRRR